MIWKIAKKEFLLNLMTFKFAVGTMLSIILVCVFVPILAMAYQERLKVYNENIAYNEAELRKVIVYKNITPTIYRPPSVLAVFSEGLEKQLGNSATIQHDKVPEVSGAAANHYLSIFSIFDTSLIFKIVISVLALLVAYDAVSGERERGTLRLTLSNTAARYQVLLGKLLAGLMVLVVPVSVSFILGLLILLSFPMVSLTASDWIRIGFMFITSLVFIATMYNLGLFFSCLARRSATSLVLGLFLWIIFAVVIPNGGAYLATRVVPVEPEDKINEQITFLQKEAERQKRTEKERLRDSYISGSSMQSDAPGGGFGHGYHRSGSKAFIHNKRINCSIETPIDIEYAGKYAEVEDSYLRGLFDQTRLAGNISRASPISLYESVMSALAGTDMTNFRQFIDSVKGHRKDIVEYMRSRTDNFTLLSFFTPYKEQQKEQERSATESDPPLDLRDLPRFDYRPDVMEILQRVIPDLAFLILGNVLFFAMAFVAFQRYDVR